MSCRHHFAELLQLHLQHRQLAPANASTDVVAWIAKLCRVKTAGSIDIKPWLDPSNQNVNQMNVVDASSSTAETPQQLRATQQCQVQKLKYLWSACACSGKRTRYRRNANHFKCCNHFYVLQQGRCALLSCHSKNMSAVFAVAKRHCMLQ